jgi:hypothetical protein
MWTPRSERFTLAVTCNYSVTSGDPVGRAGNTYSYTTLIQATRTEVPSLAIRCLASADHLRRLSVFRGWHAWYRTTSVFLYASVVNGGG